MGRPFRSSGAGYLVAGVILAIAWPGPARADGDENRPGFDLVGLVGIYQADGFGDGLDGFGARASLWAMTASLRPVHLSARGSFYSPLDDGARARSYELRVGYAMFGADRIDLGMAPMPYWALVRSREGAITGVREVSDPAPPPVYEGWWDLVLFLGMRGLEPLESEDPGVTPPPLHTAQVGIAYHMSGTNGRLIAGVSLARDTEREISGASFDMLMKSGRLSLELTLAGYPGLGYELAMSLGAWL